MENEVLLWNQPEWIAGAKAWIEQAVRAAGKRVSGPIQQLRERPWASVMTVPTSGGLYYFKANYPYSQFEARLTQELAATAPHCMPELLAVDASRGWMMTRDAGTPLRERITAPEDLRVLDSFLPMLAELQMAWLNRDPELLAMGVPDNRVQTLPEAFALLADDRETLMIGVADWLNNEQWARVRSLVPYYADLCARLLASPIPQSIHYDDMQGSNVFLRGAGAAARVTFSDWGDSCVGHPFSSLLIFLRAMSDLIGLPDEATQTPEGLPPALARLRDAYLEPWQRFDTHTNLVETFNLAWRVGMVSRAISWQKSIAALPAAYRAEYRYTVPAWLSEFLLAVA